MIPDVIAPARSWQVLLLGGASGAGKTSVSYRLARYFEVALTEVDDFQVILECMTTPEQQPVLHYWRTHPEAGELPAEQIVERQIAVGEVMLPALVAHPALAELAPDGAVRAVFLSEPDEARLIENFLLREPEHGPQHKRVRVSWLYNQWLEQQARRYGGTVIPARPWDSVLERIIAELQ